MMLPHPVRLAALSQILHTSKLSTFVRSLQNSPAPYVVIRNKTSASTAASTDVSGDKKRRGRPKKLDSLKVLPESIGEANSSKAKRNPSGSKSPRGPSSKSSIIQKTSESQQPKLPHRKYPPQSPSPFSFWLSTHYYNKDIPSKSKEENIQMFKDAAEVWKNMTGAQKMHIHEELGYLKDVTHAARIEWFKTLAPGALEEINRRRAAKNLRQIHIPSELKGIKQPPRAFVIFLQEYIAEHHQNGIGDVKELTRSAADEWKGMTEKEKEPFFVQQKQYLEEYKKQKKRRQSAERKEE